MVSWLLIGSQLSQTLRKLTEAETLIMLLFDAIGRINLVKTWVMNCYPCFLPLFQYFNYFQTRDSASNTVSISRIRHLRVNPSIIGAHESLSLKSVPVLLSTVVLQERDRGIGKVAGGLFR